MGVGVAALIPAYQPSATLLEVVSGLSGFSRIVVVNDGSDPSCDAVFDRLPAGVELLRHEVNQGKGTALKTGLRHIHATGDEVGVVTLDADGQHRPEDARLLARELQAHPGSLILGVRSFTRPGVPFFNRVGNIVTRLVFFAVVGRFIRDTQTGLRAIPTAWIPELLEIPDPGYEYELEVLLALRKRPCRQVTIQTVYLEGNKSSHFNLVRDSARIYATLIRSRLKALRAWLRR